MPQSLYIIHVQVHVKPDAIEAFRAATLANAQASVKEPGSSASTSSNRRGSDPLRAGRGLPHPDAQAAHKETAHYCPGATRSPI